MLQICPDCRCGPRASALPPARSTAAPCFCPPDSTEAVLGVHVRFSSICHGGTLAVEGLVQGDPVFPLTL